MKIGITQRVELIKSYNERRDCLDQNWFSFFEKLNINVIPIPNSLRSPISFVKNNDIKGFILSGGNDLSFFPNANNTAPERDRTEILILDYSKEKGLPVLGVCRGLQIINFFLNGNQKKSNNHVGVEQKVVALSEKKIFSDYDKVKCYHNYVIPIEDLSDDLEAILISNDKCIEAFQHKQLPWIGIMWHPERETPIRELDIELIKTHFANFL